MTTRWILSLSEQNALRTAVVLNDVRSQDNEKSVPDMTADEELVIRQYCMLISQICGPEEDMLCRPWRTKATAILFFRRFYLRNSLLQFDPRDMMLASIFLSGKVEHDYIDIDKLMAHHEKGSVDGVLRMELALLQGLEYDLQVKHAHSCVHGLIADMERDLKRRGEQTAADIRSLMNEWAVAAMGIVDNLLVSTVYIAYAPSMIAVYAIMKTAELHNSLQFSDYLRNKNSLVFDKISDICCQIDGDALQATGAIDRNSFKKTMKRLAQKSLWGGKSA